MNEQERHNRAVMLRRVRSVWLEGVLEESLHGGQIIDLGFAHRPAALGNSGVPSWQQAPEYDLLLPVGTKIEDVFAAAGRVLLVLGEPGAGKTTMLLQLVSHLMAAAEADETCPMPAVFSLAAYTNGRSLTQWLVEQLANNYEVPRKLGERWIDAGQFIPLLDGLDEVDPAHRPACAEAINEFRARHPNVALLVTARNRDYQALATRLHMDKAIILQPLSPEQIDTYLARRGKKLDGLRASLAADRTLRELAQTPLMLSIMTLAANRPPESGSAALGDGLLSRSHLFDVYVERMARYRGKNMSYSPSDTISWLSWLAKQMTRALKPTFFLEDMQPSWLPADAGRRFARSSRWMVFGLLAAAALPPVFILLLFGRWGAAGALLLIGLLAAAVPTLSGRFLLRGRLPFGRIETVESLGWSWPWAALGFGIGALVGLGLGALAAWLDRWTNTPWLALLPVAGGTLTMIENALLRGELRLRTTPGQGVAQSRRNGLMVLGMVAAVVLVLGGAAVAVAAVVGRGALVPAAAWLLWLSLYLGVGSGLSFGLLAYLQHRRLRAILHDRGSFPADAAGFLNLAAERNLLRKVGGGYTFVHALLLDYFNERP